jgi:D-arabinose 1-dehydrogenase-like Zn-dependent alcohol dehydrogenase
MVHAFDDEMVYEEALLTCSAALSSHGLTSAGVLPGDSVLFIGMTWCTMTGMNLARAMGATVRECVYAHLCTQIHFYMCVWKYSDLVLCMGLK